MESQIIAEHFQLISAIKSKQFDQVKVHMAASTNAVDVNFISLYDRNRSLLHYAVESGNPEVVAQLLEKGSVIDKKDIEGKKPIDLLAELNPCDRKSIGKVFQQHLSQIKQHDRQETHQVVCSVIPKYTKRAGTAAVGQMYETKLLTMVLFRALYNQKFNSFLLGTNLDEAGAFDDVVLRCKDSGGRDRVLFIQAKHRITKKCINFSDMICPKNVNGNYSLLKYFESYLYLLLIRAPRKDDYFEGIFKETEVKLVIFTTAAIQFPKNVQTYGTQQETIWFTKPSGKTTRIIYDKEIEDTFVTALLDWYRGKIYDILGHLLEDTINLENEIIRLKAAKGGTINGLDLLPLMKEDVSLLTRRIKCNLEDKLYILRKYPELTDFPVEPRILVQDFFSALIIYSEQATENELDDIIREDLRTIYSNDNEVIFFKSHAAVQNWWKSIGEVEYLTEKCLIFEKACKEIEVEKWHASYLDQINKFEVKFAYEVLTTLKWVSLLDVLLTQAKFCLNFLTRTPDLTCLKLNQYFEKHNEIKKSLKLISLNNCTISELLNNFCLSESSCLVIICETGLHDNIVSEILSKVQRLIIVSPQECSRAQMSVPDESLGLVDLDDDSQEKVFSSCVNFQNYLVCLRSLLDDSKMNFVDDKTLLSLLNKEILNICRSSLPANHDKVMLYYVERDFVDIRGHLVNVKTFAEIGDRVVILVAEPGMGKSTILTGLAFKLKELNPAECIVRVNLIECSGIFDKWNRDKTIVDTAKARCFLMEQLKFVSNVANDSARHLEEHLSSWFIDQRKVILLVDGFDEIKPIYRATVIQLMQCCSNHFCSKVWITTRKGEVLNFLTDSLSGYTLFLAPFTKENTIIFLWKFWKHKLKLSEDHESKCRLFASKLLHRLKNNYNPDRFMFVPIQVALVFQSKFEELCNAEGDAEVNFDSQLENMNLARLYELSVEIIFKDLLEKEKKRIQGRNKMTMKKLLDKHKKAGIYATFSESERAALFTKSEIDATENHMKEVESTDDKPEIIHIVAGSIPVFLHRTYGEYFAALFLWDQYNRLQGETFELFIKQYLVGVLIDGDLKHKICDCLQMIAQNDIGKVDEAVEKSSYLLTKLIETYKPQTVELEHISPHSLMLKIVEFTLSTHSDPDLLHKDILDQFSENDTNFILEESAKWGFTNLFRLMVECRQNCNINLPNDFNKTPLFYAQKGDHSDIVKNLLDIEETLESTAENIE